MTHWPLAGTDEDVVRPRRAVDEVPCLKATLLTFDHEHALSGNEKKVLLAALAVVHAFPLARHEHMDAEAELSPLLPEAPRALSSPCPTVRGRDQTAVRPLIPDPPKRCATYSPRQLRAPKVQRSFGVGGCAET